MKVANMAASSLNMKYNSDMNTTIYDEDKDTPLTISKKDLLELSGCKSSGLQPHLNRLIVQKIEVKEKTSGGIFLPEVTKSNQKILEYEGTIVAINPYDLDAESNFDYLPGDKILWGEYAGHTFTCKSAGGKECHVIGYSDIILKVLEE
jgi:co-chaperonin GroES (HSP10)